MSNKSSTHSETNNSILSSSSVSLAPSPLETENEDKRPSAKSPLHSSLFEINNNKSSSSNMEIVPIKPQIELSETETAEEATMISMEKYQTLKQQSAKMLTEREEKIAKMEQEMEKLKKKYQNEKTKRKELELAINSVNGIIKNALKEESADEESNDGDKIEVKEEKFEKWIEFPNEIKIHCIKSMDLKTRWFLRSTSHTERSLVDSQRFDLEYLSFDAYPYASNKDIFNGPYYDSEIQFCLTENGIENVLPNLEWILNTCDIGSMGYETSMEKPHTEEQEEKLGKVMEEIAKMKILKPIRVKELWITQFKSLMIAFLKKLPTNVDVQMSFMDADCIKESFVELATIPSIVNAKSLRVSGFDTFAMNANAIEFVPLIKTWFENDGEIGKKMELLDVFGDTIETFISHFQDNIISRNEFFEEEYKCEVRLKCNNTKKNILLVIDNIFPENGKFYFDLLFVMIPSTLQEKDHKEHVVWGPF